jgi:SAM-dependent methyltransferase
MLDSVKQVYGSSFYVQQRDGSLNSAKAILPLVFALTKPKSVVDFGCGVGTWLAAAKRLGVEHCLGLEGPWVKTQPLAAADLEIRDTDLEQTVSLQERYDLAISLEVAEHLAPERADSFVADLCRASNVVLFSAAIPGQDGDGHQNEQWPSYWAERFIRLEYMPLDVIRAAYCVVPDAPISSGLSALKPDLDFGFARRPSRPVAYQSLSFCDASHV